CAFIYCDATCQHDHWRRGHKQICKRIHRGGNAEQYNADKKYKEAVATAVEACADDTKGQTCYICTQALHWKTKEGLVRGCACRGTAGFAHVSCLAEQAKILYAEAEENNLGAKALDDRWRRWNTCSLCEQKYHGAVRGALGWACWKTYVGRPEGELLISAMRQLGNGLSVTKHQEDALSVEEAELSMLRRLGVSEHHVLTTQGNIAVTYEKLGRYEEALNMFRDVYSGELKLHGAEREETLRAANNYAHILVRLERFEEAKALFRRTIPVTRRVLGDNHRLALRMRSNYAEAFFKDNGATLDELREAVTSLEETKRIARRVFGGANPIVVEIESHLRRATLRARETPPSNG
ncbi:unnamed protein product, partial [Pelagomonas calceolata]